jgi:D-amino-acid dehydrogenase
VRVIVIGGGAVGLCAAEALSSRGAEVTVIERGRCGDGASAGNAGWVTPSLSIPVPGPGVIAQSLRWLVNPSGPLWIRPTVSRPMLRWIARFIASCPRPVYTRGLRALQAAASLAGGAFEGLTSRGVEFELHREPLLYPAFSAGELGHLRSVVSELRAAGSRQGLDELTGSEMRGLEPALGPGVVGGVLARDEQRVRPEALVAGLQRALAASGVEVLEGRPVTALTRDCRHWLVVTGADVRRADAVVIAAGVESAALLAPLGVHVPIAAAKGYSRTYARDPSGPKRAVYLEGPKVAVSAFDEGVRVSGTLELGARSLALSARRLAAITAAAQKAMPDWRMPSRPDDWAGMRSLSPDGLPFIGPVPGLEGVNLATAHATLGITLAPATGEMLARQLLDGAPSGAAAAFDPGRFVGRRTNLGTRTGRATAGGCDEGRIRRDRHPLRWRSER